jgi:hypothetical protein
MRARVAVISDAGFRNTFGNPNPHPARVIFPGSVVTLTLTPTLTLEGCADADRAEHMGAPRAAAMVPRAALLPIEVGAKQRTMLPAAARGSEGAPPQSATAGTAVGGAPPSRDVIDGSIAMVYLFVGLDASDAELGIRAQNTWVLRDYDAYAAFDHFEAPILTVYLRPTDVYFASLRTHAHAPTSHTRVRVHVHVHADAPPPVSGARAARRRLHPAPPRRTTRCLRRRRLGQG